MRPKRLAPAHRLAPAVVVSIVLGASACSSPPNPQNAGPQTLNVTEFEVTSDPSQASRPVGIAVGPDRNLWFAEFDAKSIGTLNLSTQAVSHFPIPSPNGNPTHITMGPDGELWFTETGPAESDPADVGANRIAEISASGEIKEVELPAEDSDPAGIVLGPEGHLWFTEAAASDVRRSTADGSVSDAVNAIAANSMPAGIAVGADANLWFAQSAPGIVARLTIDGVLTEFPLPTASGAPTELALGTDGNVWFTEGTGSRIGKITTDGTVSEFPTPTGNSVPEGITLGPDCNIWFTESNANLIGRIDPRGNITEYKIPTPDSQPAGIVTGPDGNLWVTESAANRIARVIPPPGSSTACAEVNLPPIARCKSAKVNTDPDTCTATEATIDDGSSDPQNLEITKITSPKGPYELGTTQATLTVRRTPLIASACAAQIEVDDAEMPNLSCPAAITAECGSPAGATVSLTATATDNCPGLGAAKCEGSGGLFPIGTTSVTCSVSDGSHNTSTCVTSVIVKDSTPPTITSISANPSVLWPPNHKGIPVTISVAASDACDSAVSSRCAIIGVTSNQSCRRDSFRITGPMTVMLPAERDGDRARSYAVQVRCSDASGNSALGSVVVTVPHDRGDHDDDGGHQNGFPGHRGWFDDRGRRS